jgi:hypothetical protein
MARGVAMSAFVTALTDRQSPTTWDSEPRSL